MALQYMCVCVCVCVCVHAPSYIQPEDGSKKPKHVAVICKFLKYLITNCVRLYFITLFN
jgi:hypothetical protein